MLSSPVLDLVILLAFIYFTGSLIVSSINEAIAASRRLRPKQLKASLENLLFDNMWTQFLETKLIVSPHIESLMSAKGTYPAYIPAENFVLAVIGIIGDDQYSTANLVNAIRTTPFPPQFQKILADLAVQSQSDLKTFELALGTFYNNAMDRAGGVYKRKIRLMLFVLGFIVAFGANLDTIKIVQDTLGNKPQLSQTVDNIVSQMPAIKNGNGVINIQTSSGNIVVGQRDTTQKALANNIKKVSELNEYLKTNSGIACGYSDWSAFKAKWAWGAGHYGSFMLSLLGILITTFALQMGSAFWFDLLSKVVNLRGTGKKPDNKN